MTGGTASGTFYLDERWFGVFGGVWITDDGAVFAFTYVDEFFRKVGFHVVERGVLPLKAWKDCLRCSKFQACDEIAVLRILRPDHWAQSEPQPWGTVMTSATDELIQIPERKP